MLLDGGVEVGGGCLAWSGPLNTTCICSRPGKCHGLLTSGRNVTAISALTDTFYSVI